jgi:hypothetical protein
MSSSQDNNTTNPERLVYETRKEAKEIRQIATRQLMRYGQLNAGTHLDLAEVVIEYEQTLREFDDDPVVDDSDYPNIEPLKQAAGRQTERTVTTSGQWVGSVHTERQPMVLNFPAEQLIRVINQLDQLARKIGFSALDRQHQSGGSRLPNPNNLGTESPDLDSESNDAPAAAEEFESNHFFRSLYNDVEGDRGGGAIVIVDAEDARTGVGKTGAACAMAEFVGWYFDYELQERDGVLSGQEYLDLFKQHPNEEQVSVCVWDEAVGAGSGDARRAMAQENVDLGRAWQLMRDRRVITFVTLPDWGDLDSRLQKLADYRVWCRRDIGSMQAYEIGTTFEGGDIRTRGLGPGEGAEPIAFPDVTDDSELYQSIKAKKDKVQETDSLSADELRDEEDDEDEAEATDTGPDLRKIADEVVEDIEEYTSIHGGNGTKYVDRDKIDFEYDLSRRDLRKVKKHIEDRVGEL